MKILSEDIALSYLPSTLVENIKKTMALYKGNVSEIRLRSNSPVYITVNNKNISCNISATRNEIQMTVRSLCGNSMYSHSETIKDGYICTQYGIRAGVCGRAVTENNKIISISDITSVCIRIPHRIKGAADEIIPTLLNSSGGMLIFSKPGIGKTTVLREIASTIASSPFNFRVAVVDTRHEICNALTESLTIDALSGYPRAKGMELALRTLSPEYIICDEISNIDDANAIFNSSGAGVPVIASTHAGNLEELNSKVYLKDLINYRIFSNLVEILRTNNKLYFKIMPLAGDPAL